MCRGAGPMAAAGLATWPRWCSTAASARTSRERQLTEEGHAGRHGPVALLLEPYPCTITNPLSLSARSKVERMSSSESPRFMMGIVVAVVILGSLIRVSLPTGPMANDRRRQSLSEVKSVLVCPLLSLVQSCRWQGSCSSFPSPVWAAIESYREMTTHFWVGLTSG